MLSVQTFVHHKVIVLHSKAFESPSDIVSETEENVPSISILVIAVAEVILEASSASPSWDSSSSPDNEIIPRHSQHSLTGNAENPCSFNQRSVLISFVSVCPFEIICQPIPCVWISIQGEGPFLSDLQLCSQHFQCPPWLLMVLCGVYLCFGLFDKRPWMCIFVSACCDMKTNK